LATAKKELETNVGLRVEEDGIGFNVSGRGELHLGVLIEDHAPRRLRI
jgi:GTP-binding protein